MTPKILGYIALVETISWTVLIIATIVKYASDTNWVPAIGPIHGVLFLALVFGAFYLQRQGAWNGSQTIRIILLSFIPIGGYFMIHREVNE